MAQLEDIVIGANISGLAEGAPVSIVATKWHGTNAMTVTYRAVNGHIAEQILYREDEARIHVADRQLRQHKDMLRGHKQMLCEDN